MAGSGLATVLELLGAEGRLPDEAGQASLFDEDQAPRPLERKGKSGPQGGRPPGARNRSTEEWAKFLLSRGAAPLPVLQDMLSWSVAELTDHLQAIADKHAMQDWTENGVRTRKILISPLDVLKFQASVAQTLALYTNKRQPVAVEVETGNRALVIFDDDIEDLQQVNAACSTQSDGARSDGGDKVLSSKCNSGDDD